MKNGLKGLIKTIRNPKEKSIKNLRNKNYGIKFGFG